MLKRRLTLIFKVDIPLRMTRHAISGCEEIMRDFNILRRDRGRKQIPLLPIDSFVSTKAAAQEMTEPLQSLTMY
jgi:hypothetical protein